MPIPGVQATQVLPIRTDEPSFRLSSPLLLPEFGTLLVYTARSQQGACLLTTSFCNARGVSSTRYGQPGPRGPRPRRYTNATTQQEALISAGRSYLGKLKALPEDQGVIVNCSTDLKDVAEARWSGAEWTVALSVALRFDHPRATVPVLVFG